MDCEKGTTNRLRIGYEQTTKRLLIQTYFIQMELAVFSETPPPSPPAVSRAFESWATCSLVV